ncbi:MAG: hypothetical protein WKF89_18035 [Chitinophagaceae bacterium]
MNQTCIKFVGVRFHKRLIKKLENQREVNVERREFVASKVILHERSTGAKKIS